MKTTKLVVRNPQGEEIAMLSLPADAVLEIRIETGRRTRWQEITPEEVKRISERFAKTGKPVSMEELAKELDVEAKAILPWLECRKIPVQEKTKVGHTRDTIVPLEPLVEQQGAKPQGMEVVIPEPLAQKSAETDTETGKRRYRRVDWEKLKEELISAYEAGARIKTLVKRYDVGEQPLRKHLASWGVEMRDDRVDLPRDMAPHLRQEDRAAITRLHSEGKSTSEIARRVGATELQVKNHLHSIGCRM